MGRIKNKIDSLYRTLGLRTGKDFGPEPEEFERIAEEVEIEEDDRKDD